jgi:hypothetical protein
MKKVKNIKYYDDNLSLGLKKTREVVDLFKKLS